MANDILAEALARIEHKLDQLLHHFKVSSVPMEFEVSNCPVCKVPVRYQIDVMKNVVVRQCNCKTGKRAAVIPLNTPGATVYGNPAADIRAILDSLGTGNPEDGDGGKVR